MGIKVNRGGSMNNYNLNLEDYNELCKEITGIREKMINVKDRMYFENNSDEIRHMNYSLDEMQNKLDEKMIFLKKISTNSLYN